MIDKSGYRPNVGIILMNPKGQVLWARRQGRTGWQFPQGGITEHENPEQAMYREVYEEIGLTRDKLAITGRTKDWFYYDIPVEQRRALKSGETFKGQKQIWFLLKFIGIDNDIRLDCSEKPEFESWKWVDYWFPLKEVIAFKRDVYAQVLAELEPLINV